MTEAAELGTRIHQAINKLVSGERVEATDVPESAQVAWASFVLWYGQRAPDLVRSEQMVYSHTLHTAGRLDYLGRLGGVLEVLDFKTGGVYSNAIVQAAVYAHCAIERGLGHVQQTRIVQLAKTGTQRFTEYVDPAWATRLAVFQAAKVVFETDRSLKVEALNVKERA